MSVDRRTVLRAALVATATAIIGEQVAGCDTHPHKSSAASPTNAAPPSSPTPTTPAPAATPGSSTAAQSSPPGGGEPASGPASAAPTSARAATPSPSPSGGPALAHEIVHGPATATDVALTFHGAGDPALAISLLAALKAANAQVTVLAVGTWLQQHPDMAMRILDAGHELGNHTYDHLTMPRLSASTDDSEITRCADLLQKLTGSKGRWFRPSGTTRATQTILAAAARAGYRECLSFDVDPLDYTDPGPSAITARVLAAVRPGSIVSMHFGHPGTVQAMPRILDGLGRRQLAAVSMSRMMGS